MMGQKYRLVHFARSTFFFFSPFSQRQSGELLHGPSILVVMVALCSGNSRIKKKKISEVFWVINPSFYIAVQEKKGTFLSLSLPFSPALCLFSLFSVLAGSRASCPWKAYSAHSVDKGLKGGNRKEIVQNV